MDFLLALHSLLRWFALAALLFVLYRAYTGFFGKKPFTQTDDKARLFTVIFIHTQLVIGLVLYFGRGWTSFWSNFKEFVKQDSSRFFGMEHLIMMVLATILITIGSAKVKRQTTDAAKFKTLAVWFTIGFVVIWATIPFAFRGEEIARPLFRSFF